MAPRRRHYGETRIAFVRAPAPRFLREDHRTDDGDTDDRWASAVMLSYLGLALLIGIVALYWSVGPRSASERGGDPPSYYLAR